jgi:cytochrome c oxidase subunit 2
MSHVRAVLVAAPLLVGAIACGADGGDVSNLSAEAAEGRRIANSRGCAGCHGSDGAGGVGPPFVGLYGSEVELEDGSVATADDDYLFRAISDPGAELVAGYSARMPDNDLSDDDIRSIITYIRELGPTP